MFVKNGSGKGPAAIVTAIEEAGITIIHFVPAMLNPFLEYVAGQPEPKIKTLRRIFASGEALTGPQVNRFNQLKTNAQLSNLYGPTEATVDVSYFDCTTAVAAPVPIGRPIDNTSLYILDKSHKIQGMMIPGELWISGAGLARGYLNQPELTREKFIANPYETGARMYRTGDVARMLPNWQIEYLGRTDRQVKIRGYRIELGEIEGELLKESGIKEAIVIANEDKNRQKYLCAYIVTDQAEEVGQLRTKLSRTLPEYMIPAYFVRLEQLPVTDSGKIDRQALPEPAGMLNPGKTYQAPVGERETKLAQIWQEVLGLEKIGINESFFELGGHSLRATIIVLRIHQELNVEVPLNEIFLHPTVKKLSEYLRGVAASTYASIEAIEAKEYYPLSSAQKRLYILNQLEGRSTAYNISGAVEIAAEIDKERVERIFKN